jgi:predicted alpha-1,6-mannanase (GH76 family)
VANKVNFLSEKSCLFDIKKLNMNLNLRQISSPRIFLPVIFFLLAMATSASAVTPADADTAFNALNQVYWNAGTKYFRKEETGSTPADFWLEAQLWDTVMDEYDRTKNAAVRKQIDDVYDGFMAKHPDWTKNEFNDDIMWWSIACTRAYKITKEERYLKQAKFSFDYVYNNFSDDVFGGGVWWKNDRRTKNSCVVCPAIISAVRLSEILNDSSYLDKAKKLYQWEKITLTDGHGKVFDSIHLTNAVPNFRVNTNGVAKRFANTNAIAGTNSIARRFRNRNRNQSPLNTFSLTYNQGTYIGASVLLYQKTGDVAYLNEAKKTADWTRDNLCTGTNQILHSENQGDGGAFKGIFVRYMKLLIDDGGCKEYLPWMETNADTAWQNRRLSDNIMNYDWSVPTGKNIQSQSAGSAVSLVVCFSVAPK